MDETVARAAVALREQFGLDAARIIPQAGGWSASAFRVETAAGRYFLKAYDKRRGSTARLIRPVNFYLPVTKWLHDHTPLHGRIINPVYTTDGRFTGEDSDHYYLMFDYIAGAAVGDNKLSADQMAELGEIVGLLHSATDRVPLPAGGVYEDFTLPFCGLDLYLKNELGSAPEDLRCIVQPDSTAILRMIDWVQRLADAVKTEKLRFVLCHTDIHNWNLMAGDRLLLVDLENLKLAPPEHDLYMILPELHAQVFLNSYSRYMPEYRISESLLEFYTIRRELEDIWEWIKQLLHDQMDVETTASALHWLRRNVSNIVKMASAR